MTDIFGPGTGNTPNGVPILGRTSMPACANNPNSEDTWFGPCDEAGVGGTIPTTQWFNRIVNNLRGLVRTAAATETECASDMLAEAAARYASLGVAGVCSGSANTYVVAELGAAVAPKTLFTGMRVGTMISATNTGASTANAFGLGAKKVLRYGGIALQAGDLSADAPTAWEYDAAADSGAGAWYVLPWALPIAAIVREVPTIGLRLLKNGGGQSIAHNTTTRITGYTINENTLQDSVVTGSSVTIGAEDAGYWRIRSMQVISDVDDVTTAYSYVYKGGVSQFYKDDGRQSGVGIAVAIADGPIQLAEGNVVEFYARHNYGSTRTHADAQVDMTRVGA